MKEKYLTSKYYAEFVKDSFKIEDNILFRVEKYKIGERERYVSVV
jgi:hypothetical protein